MMDKREQIREGLMLWMGAYGIKEEDMVRAGVELFRYLDSEGVAFIYDIQAPLAGKVWAKFIPLIEELTDV